MLAADRHQNILNQLEERGSVRTIDLAQRFNVTDETIRRDLEKLEKENLLQRTHGGATKTQYLTKDRSFEERSIQNIEEKQRIADAAVEQIQSGDRIFLDASSTALQLAQKIPNIELSVITTSSLVASELEKHDKIEIILSGGTFDRQSKSYIGAAAVGTLKRFRIDKSFISGNGIDALRGISEINESQAYIKEIVIPRSAKVIYLADSTKIGFSSTYFFAECQAIDMLITTVESSHPLLDTLKGTGIQIVYSQ